MGRLAIQVEARDHRRRVLVVVNEAGSSVVATFDFITETRDGPLTLVGLELLAKPRVGQIRITDVRKTFALGKWEGAARLAAAEELRAMERKKERPLARARPRSGQIGPPYEAVAKRYRELTRAGVRHPSAILAEELGVSPTSAWNWLRRCRELGLLAPAPGQGIAGEIKPRSKQERPRRSAGDATSTTKARGERGKG